MRPNLFFCRTAALSEVLALAGKLAPHSNGLRAYWALLRRRGVRDQPACELMLRHVVAAVMDRLGVDQHGELEAEDGQQAEDECEAGRSVWSRSPPGEVDRLLVFYGIEGRPWSPPPGWGQGSLDL